MIITCRQLPCMQTTKRSGLAHKRACAWAIDILRSLCDECNARLSADTTTLQHPRFGKVGERKDPDRRSLRQSACTSEDPRKTHAFQKPANVHAQLLSGCQGRRLTRPQSVCGMSPRLPTAHIRANAFGSRQLGSSRHLQQPMLKGEAKSPNSEVEKDDFQPPRMPRWLQFAACPQIAKFSIPNLAIIIPSTVPSPDAAMLSMRLSHFACFASSTICTKYRSELQEAKPSSVKMDRHAGMAVSRISRGRSNAVSSLQKSNFTASSACEDAENSSPRSRLEELAFVIGTMHCIPSLD